MNNIILTDNICSKTSYNLPISMDRGYVYKDFFNYKKVNIIDYVIGIAFFTRIRELICESYR
jgi:hypothetical protein